MRLKYDMNICCLYCKIIIVCSGIALSHAAGNSLSFKCTDMRLLIKIPVLLGKVPQMSGSAEERRRQLCDSVQNCSSTGPLSHCRRTLHNIIMVL
jgi:hypothetical protein